MAKSGARRRLRCWAGAHSRVARRDCQGANGAGKHEHAGFILVPCLGIPTPAFRDSVRHHVSADTNAPSSWCAIFKKLETGKSGSVAISSILSA